MEDKGVLNNALQDRVLANLETQLQQMREADCLAGQAVSKARYKRVLNLLRDVATDRHGSWRTYTALMKTSNAGKCPRVTVGGKPERVAGKGRWGQQRAQTQARAQGRRGRTAANTLFVCVPPSLHVRRTGLKRTLQRAFRSFGVKSIKLPCNRHNHTLGWGFVALRSAEGVDAAMAALGEEGVPFDPRTAQRPHSEAALDSECSVDDTAGVNEHGDLGAALSASPPSPQAPTVLAVSRSTDKRDVLFPRLSYDERISLQLDGEAFYSVTDQWTADRTSELLVALVHVGRTNSSAPWVCITDGSACVGGNTMALAQQHAVKRVRAVELDPGRAAMLQHNASVVGVAQRVEVSCSDFVRLCELEYGLDPAAHCAQAALRAPAANASNASADASRGDRLSRHEAEVTAPVAHEHIVFVDPPWGGSDYRHKLAISEINDLTLGGASTTLLLRAIGRAGAASIVSMRAPLDFDTDLFAERMVAVTKGNTPAAASCAAETSDVEERPFPFRCEVGSKTWLLFVCFPSVGERGGAPDAACCFGNDTLDDMIGTIKRWNAKYALEHHPAFYDWEKRRWIPLSRWKGYTGSKARRK